MVVQRWSFDDVVLDPARRTLIVAGSPVAVQPLALDVLHCLLDAAPRLVSRDELLAALWRRDAHTVSRNVLSNAVARLRRALGPRRADRIVTVPGAGYRFEGPCKGEPIEPTTQGDSDLPPEARNFVMRQWLQVLGGRTGFDPQLSLCDVLRNSIELAEVELAQAPLELASLHCKLADHDLVWGRFDRAAHHLDRALWLHHYAGLDPNDDATLGLRFDRCRALITGSASNGDSVGLAAARAALKAAHAMLVSNPQSSLLTRLKAACTDAVAACFDLDWPFALQRLDQALVWAEQLPALPVPQRYALHRNRGVALARSGDLRGGVAALQALLESQDFPLARDDFQRNMTRLNLGQFQQLAGQADAAVQTLQALVDDLPDNARMQTAFGIDAEHWLAKALTDADRGDEARPMLLAAHARAVRLKGPHSELALSVLPALAADLHRRGAIGEALERLEQSVTPRLDALTMPGQREAVLALACWVRTLSAAGRPDQARQLLRRLRPADVRAAVLRNSDAAEIEALRQRLLSASVCDGDPPKDHGAVETGLIIPINV